MVHRSLVTRSHSVVHTGETAIFTEAGTFVICYAKARATK